MTEKRQTSQGYIIRILQHFATKLQNITNFVIALSSCDEIFVQTCLDQNFTQKGKGLLVQLVVEYYTNTVDDLLHHVGNHYRTWPRLIIVVG
jgi:hypothetical protein